MPTQWEEYQRKRAEDAERYFNSAKYQRKIDQDKARRRELDIQLGRSPKCGLMQCHPECPRMRGKSVEDQAIQNA